MKRLALLFMLGLLATGAASAEQGEKDIFIAAMTDRLLDGRGLPADVEAQVMRLSPPERFEAVIFLRRSGLLVGAPWSVDRLLAVKQSPDG